MSAWLLMLPGASRLEALGEARASWVEPLVMPGEVTAKHARVERECAKCHEPLDRTRQNPLCLDCHTDVAADLRQEQGYHGRAPAVGDQPCRRCHAEHKGRGAALVQLDRQTFDHRLTDRPLRGAHTRAACDDCHAPDQRFREAGPHCSACHARTDPHEGCLGPSCDTCHEETAWSTVRFDHDTAAFALEGLHRRARCDACHASRRFTPTASSCVACHERHDRHRGSFGRDCQSCHTPLRKWAATEFDHARKTEFPLVGRHAGTACEACHRDGLAAAQTPAACHDCHQRADAHRGQFGRSCETCHTPADWRRPTFAHDRQTRFPLRGLHRDARCTDCHRSNPYGEHLDARCNACHRDDDVHHGRQGARCEKCHDERGWSAGVLFDHDATAFPLTGAHVRVACTGCHVSRPFKDVPRACLACHERDDVHRGKKGPQCERCHDTSDFRVIRTPAQ